MSGTIFWDITPCSSWNSTDVSGEHISIAFSWLPPAFTLISYLVYSSILKMEATCSSKMSVEFQRNTWRYIPEDSTHHLSTPITSDTAQNKSRTLLRNIYCLRLHRLSVKQFQANETSCLRGITHAIALSLVPRALVMSLYNWSERHTIPQLNGLGARTDQKSNSRKLGYQAFSC
jgi:hypothetical protein